MLPVCCHPVAILLPFKCLADNDVADVATFQTISTCKTHIKSFSINVLGHFFDGFLSHAPFTPCISARLSPKVKIQMNRAKSR
jgi:hypothetical protein